MSTFVWLDYPIRLTGSLGWFRPQIAGGTQAPRYALLSDPRLG